MITLLRKIYLIPVRIYQMTLSKLIGNCCRFEPTCSKYFCGAVLRHGIFKGTLLGVWRVWRCNPFNPGGYDPPPPSGKWKNEPCGKEE